MIYNKTNGSKIAIYWDRDQSKLTETINNEMKNKEVFDIKIELVKDAFSSIMFYATIIYKAEDAKTAKEKFMMACELAGTEERYLGETIDRIWSHLYAQGINREEEQIIKENWNYWVEEFEKKNQ